MRDIHQLLKELKEEKLYDTNEFEKQYQIKEHPARILDEYMKEQYMMLLFSTLKEVKGEDTKAIRFLYYLAKKIEYICEPEKIIKYIYTMDTVKINDCSVSFEEEEIRYLLGVEFFLLLLKISKNEESTREYTLNILNQMCIETSELKILQGVSDVIESCKLSLYHCKEYREYYKIFQCYLYKFDFNTERKLVISNCLKKVRASGSRCMDNYCSIKTVSFLRGHFVSNYNPREFTYIANGDKLGNFIGIVGGLSYQPSASIKEWNRYEEDENKYLKTEKFKDYGFILSWLGQEDDNNSYETVDLYAEKDGVLFLFCNLIDKYNLPVGVISHPLDDPDSVEDYFREIYCTTYNSEE